MTHHPRSFSVRFGCFVLFVASVAGGLVRADEKPSLPKAFLNGTGPGWKALGENDFVNVNCDEETWTWKDGVAHCTGRPTGVIRSKKQYTNFELVLQWRHLREAGNSGVFVWSPPESLKNLKPNQLPHGIEVQVLDHGYATQYEKRQKKKPDWFTTHGDVFPVGSSKMKPFPPVSPDGIAPAQFLPWPRPDKQPSVLCPADSTSKDQDNSVPSR